MLLWRASDVLDASKVESMGDGEVIMVERKSALLITTYIDASRACSGSFTTCAKLVLQKIFVSTGTRELYADCLIKVGGKVEE